MIDIYQLYLAFKAEGNMNQGGYVSPLKFTLWVNAISKELFQEKFAKWQESQELTDDMYPFLKTVNLTVVQLPGKPYDSVQFPAGFGHYSSTRIVYRADTKQGCIIDKYPCANGKTGEICTSSECTADNKYIDPDVVAFEKMEQDERLAEAMVEIIDNARWASKLTHATKKPTWYKPAVTQYEGGLKVAPKNIGVLLLDYFIVPVDAVFAYTVNPTTDEITYDANASTQLQWPVSVQPEFLARLMKKYGIAISDTAKENAGVRDAVMTNRG